MEVGDSHIFSPMSLATLL